MAFDPSKFTEYLLTAAVAGVTGYVGALWRFGKRLSRTRRRQSETDREMRRLKKWQARFDRRQLLTLELLANLCRKMGLEHRVTDLFTKIVADSHAQDIETNGQAEKDSLE